MYLKNPLLLKSRRIRNHPWNSNINIIIIQTLIKLKEELIKTKLTTNQIQYLISDNNVQTLPKNSEVVNALEKGNNESLNK